MGKIRLTGLFYLIFILCACSNSGNKDSISDDKIIEIENGFVPSKKAERMDVKEYVQWLQDPENGFNKIKTINDLTFSVQFKPFEYIVCQEERKSELADSIVQRKVAELNEMQYYDLKIALNGSAGELLKHNLSSAQQYTDRVNYFAFGMQRDIQLVEGTDTIACALYHFERSYDASPASIVLLGFPINKNRLPGDKTLLFYDRTFNTGLIKFTFSKKDLKNLPKLKTL